MSARFTHVYGRGVSPAVSVFLSPKNGIFHARAGEIESVAKTPMEAFQLAATEKLGVPLDRIAFITFSPTCVRATVKPAREPIDPIAIWIVVFFIVGALSLAALFWRHGGAS